MKKKYEESSWEEFLDRYLINYEEFVFKYKEFKIELLYAPKGEGFAIYLLKDKVVIEKAFFSSPQELLEKFRIEGKLIADIWEHLEWK